MSEGVEYEDAGESSAREWMHEFHRDIQEVRDLLRRHGPTLDRLEEHLNSSRAPAPPGGLAALLTPERIDQGVGLLQGLLSTLGPVAAKRGRRRPR